MKNKELTFCHDGEKDIYELLKDPNYNPSLEVLSEISKSEFGHDELTYFFEIRNLTWETFISKYIPEKLNIHHISKDQHSKIVEIMDCIFCIKINW